MGHHGRPRHPQREVLLVLHGALSRHHLQHDPETEAALLHRQPHHPLCGHLRSVRRRLLSPLGERREGQPVHLHPAVPDVLFPRVGGDCSVDLPSHAPFGEVSPLHHDPGHPECGLRSGRPQRPLPVTVVP
ncbi:hypothetical protein AVEN_167554-1 [Araneus ventricosus]|uniref:Uncharacterized protein n=1 Tax=Araneus ventricosus TaxID=182803 RepID=A0A4Y2E743_ARAVE|nr:hypothetical protein AVEN_11695-1 [Araneus ventricosus]GBM24151.1 hypothetical protein AVEN_167554-1 [Araneus ventricosus]